MKCEMADIQMQKLFCAISCVGCFLLLCTISSVSFLGKDQTPGVELLNEPININSLIKERHFSLNVTEAKTQQEKRLQQLKDNCDIFLKNVFEKSNHQDIKNLTYFEKWIKDFKKRQQDLRNILVNDANKLLYCTVPKVASTNWRRFFLALENKQQRDKMKSISHRDMYFGPVLAGNIPFLRAYPQPDIETKLNTFTSFLFVRNPFERLLSAYRDKFEKPRGFDLFFEKTIGKKIIENFRDMSIYRYHNKGRVTFEEFIQYIISIPVDSHDNEHWDSVLTLCQPCFTEYDFIGKYESFKQDTMYLFNLTNITDIEFPNLDVPNSHQMALHSDAIMKEYYSRIPIDLIQQIYIHFQRDFRLFDYGFPKVLLEFIDEKATGY